MILVVVEEQVRFQHTGNTKRREQYQSTQRDELYSNIWTRVDHENYVRFYENKQTAREVYKKCCFGRKRPQNDILTCMCRLEIDYWEREKSFDMV